MKGGDLIITHVLESMNEVITNDYDQGHKAIDIVASDKSEAKIIAIENGTVETVVNNIKGTNHKSKGTATYGNYVKIKQDNGKTALYAHIKHGSIQVHKGQKINKGDIIGTIGETGNAYGKHLHLEVRNSNNIKENPLHSLNTPSKQVKTTPNNKTNTTQTIKQSTSIKKVTNTKNTYLNASNYHYGSIVDALKSIGENSSYSYRKKLAENNGITSYHGSYSQNIKLLNLLKNGKLKKV